MAQQANNGNGKICYLEIPSKDIQVSADFYKDCFDWSIRTRGDGATAFDDGVGGVGGTWVLGRDPATDPVIHIYIMVYDAAATLEKINAKGGKTVMPVTMIGPTTIARFSDPAGNVFSLYQQEQ